MLYRNETLGVAVRSIASRTKAALRPSSIQAMRRGSQTPRCVVLLEARAFYHTCFRAGLRQEDPPNLNILLSGGKETNKDSLSNGE